MKIRKTSLFILLFLGLFFPCYCEKENSGGFIDKVKWTELSKNYDFTENYKEFKPKEKEKKSKKEYKPLFTNLSWMKYVLIVLLIGFLLILLIFLVIGTVKKARENVQENKKYNNKSLEIENIEEADLESMLQDSLSNGRFKDALRFKYLILIQDLNRLALVIWKKDKTNGSYIKEMYGKQGFEIFRDITITFERIWYGDKTINETIYKNVIPLFDDIDEIITTK